MNTLTIEDKYWDDAVVGEECISPPYAVTEARVMAYADLTGDHTPVHTDEAYARTTPFGTRVAHGLFGLSIADGLKTRSDMRFMPGMSLGWEWSFVAPIKLGDTVRVRFRVETKRESKSKPGWGILVLPSELINQRDEVVQKGEHRVMVPRRPA
ncbi:MaoC family dehydratase [Variovorax guangxiensis]|uniref:Acyl dehydratase n=1 Tax=Variovorax guangxiensis TaxID=1775474 RepID=A0A840FGH2_9BURK|nr:MaoC family dehydratase [Variovorax guangxiensis]MBB4221666.1 acyl dehydratase [Variovorax guangxiensis]